MIVKNTTFTLILFASLSVFAQKKYQSDYSYAEKSIDGVSLIGYATSFDFSREAMRKSWWKHARNFGHPNNMRTYYTVKIPNEMTDGTEDVLVYTQATDKKGNSTFFLGVKKDKKQYKKQALKLLVSFKKQHYIYDLNKRISKKQDEIDHNSMSYEFAETETAKKTSLKELYQHQHQIKELRKQIKAIVTK